LPILRYGAPNERTSATKRDICKGGTSSLRTRISGGSNPPSVQ
jgi:hypothetical protein